MTKSRTEAMEETAIKAGLRRITVSFDGDAAQFG
jgi:hypothetical protein